MPESPPEPTVMVRRDGTEAQTHGAARGYSWEPFKSGHLVSVKHGTRSPRLLGAKSDEVREALDHLVATCPWVTPLDAGAVDRYCPAEARAVMLNDYVMATVATKGPEEVPVTLWDSANRSDLAADKLAASLGLTPADRARLVKDLGVAHHYATDDLSDLAAEGRRIRERRMAELASESSDETEPA